MKPERNKNSLVEVVDHLLEKGLVLNADVIISVAGVPLIALSLKAALAGIETMLEYGMLENMDRETREWAKQHRKTSPSLLEGESVALKCYGSSYLDTGAKSSWRYAFLHVTNQRIFAWEKAFNRVLYEMKPEEIESYHLERNIYMEEERLELHLILKNGDTLRLHAANMEPLAIAVKTSLGEDKQRSKMISSGID